VQSIEVQKMVKVGYKERSYSKFVS
jgi:hypothetical protein